MIPPAETGSNLVYMVVLLAIAALFFVVEVCTPTFGIMAFAAVAAEIAALVFAFSISPGFGLLMLVACLIGTPAYLYFMVKVLPKTPLGRLLVLSEGRKADREGTPETDRLGALVGKRGVALGPLRPVGKVRVDGATWDARTERGMIQKGTDIEVIKASGTDVVVRTAPARADNDKTGPPVENTDEERN